jgi:hypothetical protein
VCSIGLEIHSKNLLARRVIPDDLPSDSSNKIRQSETCSNDIYELGTEVGVEFGYFLVLKIVSVQELYRRGISYFINQGMNSWDAIQELLEMYLCVAKGLGIHRASYLSDEKPSKLAHTVLTNAPLHLFEFESMDRSNEFIV